MGFTSYCLICGGPGTNCYYYNDSNDEDNYEDTIFINGNKDTEWLDKVQSICKSYITDIGELDEYGFVNVEGDNNLYCISGEYNNDIVQGLLVHNICLSMTKNIIKNFDNKKFFNIFKNHFGNRGYLLDNINYYGIEKNLGQDYDVKKGEEYFLAEPIDIKICLKDKINKQKYLIPNFLPPEIQNIILEHIDFKTKSIVSNVCYYWYEILRNQNTKNKIKNKDRITKCINLIDLIYQKNYLASDSSNNI